MSSTRNLLSRVRKLEVDDVNPILKKIGSVERFEQLVREHIPDSPDKDGDHIIRCVLRWVHGTNHVDVGHRQVQSWGQHT